MKLIVNSNSRLYFIKIKISSSVVLSEYANKQLSLCVYKQWSQTGTLVLKKDFSIGKLLWISIS